MRYAGPLSRIASGLRSAVEFSNILGSYKSRLLAPAAFMGSAALASIFLPEIVQHSAGQLFRQIEDASEYLRLYTDSDQYFEDECIFAIVDGKPDTEYGIEVSGPEGLVGGGGMHTNESGFASGNTHCFDSEKDPAGDYVIWVGNEDEETAETVHYVP